MTNRTIKRTAKAAEAIRQSARVTPREFIPPPAQAAEPGPVELGGPEGPEPTRFGDWERKGRCIDF